MTYPANTVPCPDCEGRSVDYWGSGCIPCGGRGYIPRPDEAARYVICRICFYEKRMGDPCGEPCV